MVEIFTIFLRLGLTSFGGPIAHLAYFHDEFVRRRQWLNQREYADCVSLAQFLPGPSSSQVGFAIGLRRGGLIGGLAAWLGFTLPSAVLMALAATLLVSRADLGNLKWLLGINLLTLAVVLHALWSMARTFWSSKEAVVIGLASVVALWWYQGITVQIAALVLGGVIGVFFLKSGGQPKSSESEVTPVASLSPELHRSLGGLAVFIALFLAILVGSSLIGVDLARFALRLFRIGATVFGGGHVVLPLMSGEFVATGEVDADQFDALYGLAQALPGPLFAIASGVGVLLAPSSWIWYAIVAVVAVFLPGLTLMSSLLPFWLNLRGIKALIKWTDGVNAASVGLLISVFHHSSLVATVKGWPEMVVVGLLFGAITKKVMPTWLLLPISAVVGLILF